jgi:hypothetical protein
VNREVPVPRVQLRRLADELAEALHAVTQARAASDALEVLTQVTVAIEELSATQHELVNVLLDHGHTWSQVGNALNTSAAAAERRYPRRKRRGTASSRGGPGEAALGGSDAGSPRGADGTSPKRQRTPS